METTEIPVARGSVSMTNPPLTARELKLIDEKRVVIENLHHALGTMCAENEQLRNRIAELEEILACSESKLACFEGKQNLREEQGSGETYVDNGASVSTPHFPIQIPPIEKSEKPSGPAPWWVEGFINIYGAVRTMTAEVATAGQSVSDTHGADGASTERPPTPTKPPPPPSNFQVRGPEEFDIGLPSPTRSSADTALTPLETVHSLPSLLARTAATPPPRAETPPRSTTPCMPPPVVTSPVVQPVDAPPTSALSSIKSSRMPTPPPGPPPVPVPPPGHPRISTPPPGPLRLPTPPPGHPPEREFQMPIPSTVLSLEHSSSTPQPAGVIGGIVSAPLPSLPHTIGFGSTTSPPDGIGNESAIPPLDAIGCGSATPPPDAARCGSATPPPDAIGCGSATPPPDAVGTESAIPSSDPLGCLSTPPMTPLPSNVI